MSGTESYVLHDISHCDNEEEFDHKLKKQMRQLEGEHKIEKAILEQKIELLEVKVREFEEREAALKKMNSEILLTLNDLNKKEDSVLMNKVCEELAIANKEKLREKKQQQTKLLAIKSHMELNIQDLKERLAKSEREKKELETEYNNRLLKYENELEQERKAHEATRKEFEEKKSSTKGSEECQRLKRRVALLEEENNNLKKEYEKETSRLRFEFERNLAELKEIHGQERSGFESRLKKTKEQLTQAEAEVETKTAVETQLSQEIARLKEKVVELESNNALEVERITSEKDTMQAKVQELEKNFDEAKSSYEKAQKAACNTSTDLFAQNLEERLKALEDKEQKEPNASKTPNTKPGSRNTLCEQGSVDQLHTFINFESQMPSLSSSIIHEPYIIEQKKSTMPSHSQMLVPDLSQYWSNDEHIRMAYSKPITRTNSRHDLNYLGQPQTPTYCYNDPDNRRSMVRSICAHSEKTDNLHAQGVMSRGYPERSMKESQYTPTKDMTATDGHPLREWALKDTSQVRGNWSDQNNIKLQNRIAEEEEYGAYASENPVGADVYIKGVKEAWTYDSVLNKRRERGQIGARVHMNYPERTLIKNEGPSLLRRNGSFGMTELPGGRDLSSEKLDLWRDCSTSILKGEESQYNPGQDIYKKGLQEVMTGLRNIKTRLEKQQEDIIIAKNESINEMSKRTRSFSNAKVRPGAAPRDTVNTNSFYIPYERARGYSNTVNVTEANRSVHMTDENSVNLHNGNVSSYGEAQTRYLMDNVQTNYRTRTPVLVRGATGSHYQGRHRNSLA